MAADDADTTAWLDWIVSGSYKNARRLLREDQDVNVRGARGMTALHVVAEIGALLKVQRLLADGADLRLTNADGKTPLQLAQREAKMDVAYYLVECQEMVRALTRKLEREPTAEQITDMLHSKTSRDFRQNVSKYVEERTTKFLQAAREGDLATVQSMVLDGGLSVDAMDPKTGETAFSIALAGCRRRMYEFLLKNGAHPYGWCVVDGRRLSVVSVVVSRGDVDLVRLVVTNGSQVHTAGIDAEACVLAEAMQTGSSEMVEVLLAAGARFNWDTVVGELPWRVLRALEAAPLAPWQLLYCACWQQDKRRVNALFASHEELRKAEKVRRYGEWALFLSANRGDNELSRELLARGAPVSIGALHCAVRAANAAMLRMFLDHHADTAVVQASIPELGSVDDSLLFVAVKEHAFECVQLLFPLETREAKRHSALVAAVRRGNYEMVDYLLEQVQPSSKDGFLECLRATQCPLVLDLLLTRCWSSAQPIEQTLELFTNASLSQDDAELLKVLQAHGCGFDRSSVFSIWLGMALPAPDRR